MAITDNRKIRIIRRDFELTDVETYTTTMDTATTLRTGLQSIQAVFTTDNSYIMDFTLTFIGNPDATSFQTDARIKWAGETLVDSNFAAPVVNVISDSLIFLDAANYNAFYNEWKADKCVELILNANTYN